ncbi:hypothetical protein TRVA0_026S02190 [Trichomonascus vanleenenianus]|uniref:uncharacterized protein n=1 Tax=Trichomonascus vanleenenianus TaxID=2268995 RepID=UPI003ECA0EB8
MSGSKVQNVEYNDAASLEKQDFLEVYVQQQIAEEAGNDIRYRTCSWYKIAALMGSEYICLAALSFGSSFQTLGLLAALLITAFFSLVTLYASLILHQYCLRHPDVQDLCDVGKKLCGGSKFAWLLTAIAFVLNNIFIESLHVLTGAKYLNTMSDHALCTVVFTVVTAIACFFFSMPRTFSAFSYLSVFAAVTMFLAILLTLIFAGIQDHPNGYDGQPVTYSWLPPQETTFVDAMNAMLNIVFLFVGLIPYPSFIAEMKEPRDFPKALWLIAVCELVVYSLIGSIIYVYAGDLYTTSPAIGVLTGVYKKVAFSFTVPTIVFLGCLFAAITGRFIMFNLFKNNRQHLSQNTLLGWGTWIGILLGQWIIAYIIASTIPTFNDILSIMSALFISFFGFIFWGAAYIQMKSEDLGKGWYKRLDWKGKAMLAVNILMIVLGLFILGPGTYATVESIIDNFRSGNTRGVFTCATNGI